MRRLEGKNLVLGYDAGKSPIIQGLTIALNPGQFVGVVGPNGSGKSTLVRALTRVLSPQSGVVLLDGRDLYTSVSARESARSIAAVPQSTMIAFEFTVREIVEMGRSPHVSHSPFARSLASDAAIVEESMAQAGVAALSARIASTLSGGEQQRVLLARALAQEPEVLLLDEPTSHLDLHHQTQVLRLVRNLTRDRGMATLAVLHDLNQAAEYCDQLILTARGTVVADGPPAEVLTREHVRDAYGARVWVRCHPISGRPLVMTLPDGPDGGLGTEQTRDQTIHVVCGGGSGAGLLLRLRQHGFTVSAGALNSGDTDQEAAEMLGIAHAAEAPFTGLTDSILGQTNVLMQTADAITITDVPFGPGNIANLQLARACQATGTPIFALSPETSTFNDRDFTGGEAGAHWAALTDSGMQTASDVDSLIDLLLQNTPS